MGRKTFECWFCDKSPDGPMLQTSFADFGHVECVIEALNQLLDPDWFPSSTTEPARTIGYLEKESGNEG